MTDNKYYTPEIEEFHQGFEYEIFEDWDTQLEKSWHKQVFGKDGDNHENLGYVNKSNLDIIRVPYLTKEDIEAEGFKYDEKLEEYISTKTFFGIGTGDDKKLRICHNEEIHHEVIYYQSNRGDEFIKFEGFIKNKSEFKKVLKMIGV